MTREEIMALEAGHELNVLMAELLGYQVFERYGYYYIATDEGAFERGMEHGLFVSNITSVPGTDVELCLRLPLYSTRIGAAWEAVEKLTADDRDGVGLYCKITHQWDKGYGTWAVFDWKGTTDTHPLYSAQANTTPLAICRAALLTEAEDD